MTTLPNAKMAVFAVDHADQAIGDAEDELGPITRANVELATAQVYATLAVADVLRDIHTVLKNRMP